MFFAKLNALFLGVLLVSAPWARAEEEISDSALAAVTGQSGISMDVEFRLNASANGAWNGVPNKFSYKNAGSTEWLVLNQDSGRLYFAGLNFDIDELLGIPALVVSAPGKLYFSKWNIQSASVESASTAQNPATAPSNGSVIGFQTDAVWNLNGQARFFTVSPSAIKVPY